jgi:hypothetical protein
MTRGLVAYPGVTFNPTLSCKLSRNERLALPANRHFSVKIYYEDDIHPPNMQFNRTAGGVRGVTACPRVQARSGWEAMSNKSESDDQSADPVPARPIASPKRGAFPTPKSEIEKATPYVPDVAPPADDTTTEPAPSTSGDDTKRG